MTKFLNSIIPILAAAVFASTNISCNKNRDEIQDMDYRLHKIEGVRRYEVTISGDLDSIPYHITAGGGAADYSRVKIYCRDSVYGDNSDFDIEEVKKLPTTLTFYTSPNSRWLDCNIVIKNFIEKVNGTINVHCKGYLNNKLIKDDQVSLNLTKYIYSFFLSFDADEGLHIINTVK